MSLSDKIIWDKNSGFGQGNRVLDTLDIKDIKEAIKELKEADIIGRKMLLEVIDKIFGDALVNKSERGFKNGR